MLLGGVGDVSDEMQFEDGAEQARSRHMILRWWWVAEENESIWGCRTGGMCWFFQTKKYSRKSWCVQCSEPMLVHPGHAAVAVAVVVVAAVVVGSAIAPASSPGPLRHCNLRIHEQTQGKHAQKHDEKVLHTC